MAKPHPVMIILFVLLFSFLGFYAGALTGSLFVAHESGFAGSAEVFIYGILGFFVFFFLLSCLPES